MVRAGLFVVFAGLACVACAASDANEPAPPLPSSLVEAESTLGQSTDACSAMADGDRRALTSELEPLAAQLDRYVAENLPSDAHYRRVQLGPTYIRELLMPLPPPAAPVPIGWSNLRPRLDALQGKPIDLSWVALNESVRAQLVNDWNRLELHVDDSPSAAAARAKPGIVRPNGGVTRDGAVLRVKLDAGPFDGVREQLRALIEPVWSDANHRLVIDFTPGDPQAFRIMLDAGPGGRSLVRWSDRTVHLFADVRAKSIAHEIGHVLGFVDHYQTVFDEQHCGYMETADPNDLMADPSRGSVTAAEWSALDSAY